MIEATASIPQLAGGTRAKLEVLSLRSAKQTVAPARADAVSAADISSRSRLAYDRELARVFVEIVGRRSGEVVHRYPPEEIVRHISALIEQQHLPAGQGDTGFLVGRSV